MAIDLALLTTKKECDDALLDLQAELEGYQHRTSNLDYAASVASRNVADTTGRLAGVQAEIDGYTATLAVANLPTALRKQTESKLRRANDRKDNLSERHEARTGTAAFLAGVDAEQNAQQEAVLADAIAQVTAHRATLSA